MGTRTERIGTIFSRVTSLVEAGTLKKSNLPVWYEIYKVFPPKMEPMFGRPTPQKEIMNIFYKEDEIRAKFYGSMKRTVPVNLMNKKQSQCQLFLNIYNSLPKNEMSKEEAYNEALSKYKVLFNIENDAPGPSQSKYDSKNTKTQEM